MSKSEADIRKIKDKLLRHTTLLSGFIQKVSIPRSKEQEKNILLFRREIQTILKELSLLNRYYSEVTQRDIILLSAEGTIISLYENRTSIIDNMIRINRWISGINSLKLSKPIVIEPELDSKFEILNQRFEKNLTILRPSDIVRKILLVLSFLGIALFIAASFLVLWFPMFNLFLDQRMFYLLGITAIIAIISDEYYKYIEKRHRLSNADLLYLHTGRVISLLDGYIKNNSSSDRRKAIELMEKIINLVNKWNYGNLNFIKNQFGTSIDLFKDNLNKKIAGVTNVGNDQDIKLLIDILSDFLRYMLNPSIKELNDINKLIEPLSSIELIKFRRKDKFTFWIYSNPIYLRIISAIVASSLYYFIGIKYLNGTPLGLYPYTVGVGISLFLGIDRVLSLDKKLAKLSEKRSKAGIT